MNDLIIKSPDILNQTLSKILRFGNESNSAIDSIVGQERSAILENFQKISAKTESAIDEYLQHVTSDTNITASAALSAEDAVVAASIQLHNKSRVVHKNFEDALEAVQIDGKKNNAIMNSLRGKSSSLQSQLSAETSSIGNVLKQLQADRSILESQFFRNLTDLAAWLGDRVSVFNQSIIRDDYAVANRTLTVRNRLSKRGIDSRSRKIRKNLNQILTSLNETDLFSLIRDLQTINQTMRATGAQAHDAMTLVLRHKMDIANKLQNEEKSHFIKKITTLDTLLRGTAERIPNVIRDESGEAVAVLKDIGNEIEQTVQSHMFNIQDQTKSVGNLAGTRLKHAEDSVHRLRLSIKDAVKHLGKNKDYSVEIANMKESIANLKRKQDEFKDEQEERIRNWTKNSDRG
jgi:hypothetical protein